MKIKPIKQRDADACAPTCIEMTLQYFNIPHTVEDIAKVTNYKKEGGMYNRQLVDAFSHYQLKTKTYRNTTWEKLKELNTKDSVTVLSWMLEGYIGHFSVVEKIDKKYIYLAEPTTGNIEKIEKIQFMRLWHDYEAKAQVPMFPETKAQIQLRWMCVISKQ